MDQNVVVKDYNQMDRILREERMIVAKMVILSEVLGTRQRFGVKQEGGVGCTADSRTSGSDSLPTCRYTRRSTLNSVGEEGRSDGL